MAESQGGTGRRCTRCGEMFFDGHDDCASVFKEILTSPPDSASSIDEMPAEASAHAEDPTRRLFQYVLTDEIGKGGMGKVWKAWDTKLTRWAAIKFLNDESLEDIRRFEREAKLAARLRHPNIAAIYEVGEVPAQRPGQSVAPFIAMEYVDGPTLAAPDLAKSPRDWVELFAKVAEAVHAAHRAGVVHRDLKPHNIMLNRAGWPYVMDFGLAKSLKTDSTLSASGVVMGTPSFMPPEQAQAKVTEIDEKSDVYSLGATLYAVLARTAPFAGSSNVDVLTRVIFDAPESPRKLNPEIPLEVETIILKAMSREKVDRYETALALAEDLRRWLASEEIVARRPGPIRALLRQFRHRPIASTIVVALALASLGGLLWTLLHPVPRTVVVVPDRGREELARFLDNLATVKSEPQLRALTDRDFATLFALPSPSDAPAFPWVRDLRPLLDAVRAGKEPAESLLAPAAAAAPLVSSGENGPFKSVVEIAADGLARAARREVEAAQDEPREKVAGRRSTAGMLLDAWSAFVARLPAGFLPRHAFVVEHTRSLEEILQGFPADLAELAEIRLDDCLAAPNPEAELSKAEEKLRALLPRTRVTIESRRELWTSLVSVSALRAFYAGRSEDEAAQALKDEGEALRRSGATATKAWGPRVQSVLERLLR